MQKIYGLRDYTKAEIEELKVKHPQGVHKTHKHNGEKLPFNGVFFAIKPRSRQK